MPGLQRRLRRAAASPPAAAQNAVATRPASDSRRAPPGLDDLPAPTARILAAAQPPRTISLDNLLLRHTPRTKPQVRGGDTSSALRHSETPTVNGQGGSCRGMVATSPIALVLPIVTQHCTGCGRDWIVPGAYVLAKYDAGSFSFRYSRADLSAAELALPRERRDTRINIPFCHECF